MKRWVVGDERVGKPAPPRPAAVQGSALAQRGPAWLTACFCPGDFAHLVAAVCSDLSLTVFHNDPDGAALLTVFTRSPVYCLSPSRDYSELGFGDEFGNVYILTLE